MPVTVRTYTTGSNWTASSFFTMLGNAFRDLGYFPATNREFGLSDSTAFGGTTLAGQANREYIVNQTSCAISGQAGTRWYIQRNSSGTIAVDECLSPGTGYQGHGTEVSGTYSQTGTTVVITRAAHGLPVGRRVYLDFTSGTATDQLAVVTAVTANTFTCTLTTSATTSGAVRYHGCAGNYSRSGSTVTATIENHGLTTGGRIYADYISGTATDNIYSITATDANTLTWTDTGSGTTSGIVLVGPLIRIKGSDIGGTDDTDDFWLRVDSSGGAPGNNNDWALIYNSNQGVVWDRVVDNTKTFGRTFTSINMVGNTFFVRDQYTVNPGTAAAGGTSFYTRPRNPSLSDSNYTAVYTLGSGTSVALTLRVFVSELDSKFAVFQFSQGTTDYPAIVFHVFAPAATAPYSLDRTSQSGYTSFSQLSEGIRIDTPGYGTVPALSAEGRYTSRNITDFVTGSMRYEMLSPGANNTSPKLYHEIALPANINFGPLVNKIPLNPAAIPTFYVIPDDFGFISTVGASQLRAGDTITASASEVYTVIVSSSSANGVSFTARTT